MLGVVGWIGLALAGSSSAEVDGGKVRGVATLPVAPDVVIAALADPAWENRVQGGNTQVTVTARDGACHQAAYVVPHPIMTASYELRRCRGPQGWDVTLVASDSFEQYRGAWTAVPEAGGTRLTFEVELVSAIRWVPQSIVRGEMKKGVGKMMAAIAAWGEAKAAGGG